MDIGVFEKIARFDALSKLGLSDEEIFTALFLAKPFGPRGMRARITEVGQ